MTLKRLFVERTHYIVSALALSLILSGLLLMTGEGSSNETFCPDIRKSLKEQSADRGDD